MKDAFNIQYGWNTFTTLLLSQQLAVNTEELEYSVKEFTPENVVHLHTIHQKPETVSPTSAGCVYVEANDQWELLALSSFPN